MENRLHSPSSYPNQPAETEPALKQRIDIRNNVKQK